MVPATFLYLPALKMWSFFMANEASDKPFSTFQVSTRRVEQYAGILLWPNLVGSEIRKEKERIRDFWRD